MGEWGNVAGELERFLRPRSFPLALKFLDKAEEMEKLGKVRRPDGMRFFCQLLTTARSRGWTIGVSADNFPGVTCGAMLGLCERSEFIRDGTFRSIMWYKDKEEAKKFEDIWPTIPTGKHEAVVISPLAVERFDPDMVLIYGKPAQMVLLMCGLQYENYERFTFYFSGESSCADYIAQCYLTKKPSLGIPCWGEIRWGHAWEDELVMALSGDLELAKGAISGMAALRSKGGIRYPMPYSGATAEVASQLMEAVGQMLGK